MGSLFSQKMVKCAARELTDWARSSRASVIASSPAGLLDYRAFRFRWPAVLLMGSEKHGLSEHLIESSDFTVRIPMRSSCDSINVAVAAGVLLYEIFNQYRGV
jgi:TrmH family RNA methyltransferase